VGKTLYQKRVVVRTNVSGAQKKTRNLEKGFFVLFGVHGQEIKNVRANIKTCGYSNENVGSPKKNRKTRKCVFCAFWSKGSGDQKCGAIVPKTCGY